jgi:hypothetical protein
MQEVLDPETNFTTVAFDPSIVTSDLSSEPNKKRTKYSVYNLTLKMLQSPFCAYIQHIPSVEEQPLECC